MQYAAGVFSELSEEDLTSLALQRATEAAHIIESGALPGAGPVPASS